MHKTLPSPLGHLGRQDAFAFVAFHPPEGAPIAHTTPVSHVPEAFFYKLLTPFCRALPTVVEYRVSKAYIAAICHGGPKRTQNLGLEK